MHVPSRLLLLAMGVSAPLAAQTACTPSALSDAAATATTLRKALRAQAVPHDDPAVPPAIADQLRQFKDALARTAEAALACASPSVSPETLQGSLARALHLQTSQPEAIDPDDTEAEPDAKDSRDHGSYGADLAVQVFQLFGSPRFFEVDFRYGVECGDDNLLLVFQTASDHAADTWHERLRWDAPSYTTVADAFGDFVLLTPLTGSYKAPTWRFLVAHGNPGCGKAPRDSQFDLNLLAPTADPAKPRVDWHFRQAYAQGSSEPRLSTTEDSIDFRLIPLPATGSKPALPAASPQIYRFHLGASGAVEPSPSSAGDDQHP